MEVVWKHPNSKEDEAHVPNHQKYTRYLFRVSGVVTEEHRWANNKFYKPETILLILLYKIYALNIYIHIVYSKNNASEEGLEPFIHITEMFYNHNYSLYYTNLATFFMLEVFPISLLIYYNIRIYKAMKLSSKNTLGHGAAHYSRNKQENSLVKVMIGIVIVFIACHCLRVLVYIYILLTLQNVQSCNEAESTTFLGPLWFYICFSLACLLLAINSSVNMIIYCCANSKFRKHLFSIIMPFSSRNSTTTIALVIRR